MTQCQQSHRLSIKKSLIYSFETWLKGYTTYLVYLNEKNQNMINIYPAYRYINVNVVQICTFACYKKMPREKKKQLILTLSNCFPSSFKSKNPMTWRYSPMIVIILLQMSFRLYCGVHIWIHASCTSCTSPMMTFCSQVKSVEILGNSKITQQ